MQKQTGVLYEFADQADSSDKATGGTTTFTVFVAFNSPSKQIPV